jgi:hypothetical protein
MGDSEKNQSIDLGGDANKSTIVSGDRATITINNYYYREDTQSETVGLENIDLPCTYRGLLQHSQDIMTE